MQISCLAPHGLQNKTLVPVFRKLRKVNSSTVRSYPTNNPPILDGIIWITLKNRVLKQLNRVVAFLRSPLGPLPGRWQPRFRLASGWHDKWELRECGPE